MVTVKLNLSEACDRRLVSKCGISIWLKMANAFNFNDAICEVILKFEHLEPKVKTKVLTKK